MRNYMHAVTMREKMEIMQEYAKYGREKKWAFHHLDELERHRTFAQRETGCSWKEYSKRV
jgi:hypothetical protein